MPNSDSDNVVDADVVDTDSAGTPAEIPTANSATVLIELESMIKSHITGIDKRKKELKKFKEMIKDTLTNDSTYRTQDEDVKKATKVRNATRTQILKMPANAQIVDKIHELTAEVKEMDDALSDYLREFQRLSGANEIESEDGEVMEIVYTTKLIKKSSR